MSGSLFQALMGGMAPQAQQAQQAPLASMAPQVVPNGAALQLAHPSMPWYAIPGMFQQPPQQPVVAQPLQQQPVAQQVDPAQQAAAALGAGSDG